MLWGEAVSSPPRCSRSLLRACGLRSRETWFRGGIGGYEHIGIGTVSFRPFADGVCGFRPVPQEVSTGFDRWGLTRWRACS